ncbi:hypothetical protein RHMOL_Rhmol09G0169100 [Rhododendron molle]|uniref:Uncharacterized protein n=1 Tax=Rhododendron molle TaxID=49168 RepID=A0ACC0ME96_RHOML|nr:hypothetical protein RHMOL_Rhmol09G0169100 [Rhododendron molle]
MNGGGGGGRSSPPVARTPTRSAAIGRIQLQPCHHRTIYCNDRDALTFVSFKVPCLFQKPFSPASLLAHAVFDAGLVYCVFGVEGVFVFLLASRNSITTAKYNLLTFLPKFLFEQWWVVVVLAIVVVEDGKSVVVVVLVAMVAEWWGCGSDGGSRGAK